MHVCATEEETLDESPRSLCDFVCGGVVGGHGWPVGRGAAARRPIPHIANSPPALSKTFFPIASLDESVARHDAVELLAVDENFDWAKEIPFRHDVWTLDFRFKPVRMIWVDVPGAKGQMQRKLVWYMVYSVTNPGKTMHPVEQPDGTYKVEFVDRAGPFPAGVSPGNPHAHERRRPRLRRCIRIT